MPEYVDEAFTVLVHIHGSGGAPRRETYVVGCPTREEAEARIRGLYPLELEVKVFATSLSATETKAQKLMAGEFRPWESP
ncbi:hypothetical protein SAMN05444169_0553 [Bradyrhizobium erythrophlei]|jgi:hypothetical protein|uniref:Uncharacterized protein n=1 Tax=Bradyrhizobium erythrophlei TaxID=1437360 RepID=A0A1M5H330_9BRAD|nr:hypothetical protein SAMN05444169_0553 [Bradyrhizobium erythrophlei]